MNNLYINPTAGKPENPTAGLGGLIGLNYMRDRESYTQNMKLQQIIQEIERQRQQEELTQGASARQAKWGQESAEADLATVVARAKGQTPGYGQAMAGGAMGEANFNQARGTEAMGTVGEKVGATNEENKFKQIKSFLQRLEMSTPVFEDQTPVAAGVTRGKQAYGQFLQQLPPKARSMLPQEYNSAQMGKIRQSLVNSVEQHQKERLDKIKTDSLKEIGEAHDTSAQKVAQINADSRVEAAYARLSKDPTYKRASEIVAEGFRKQWEGKQMTPHEIEV